MEYNLDLTDRKILTELDKNCRISNAELGKRVHKSREAVKYRINQLIKKGIIEKFITAVNPNKFGYMMFKVYLKLENIPEQREAFFEELKSNKDIYWLGISDGVFDCVFAVLSKGVVDYFERINDILSRWDDLVITKVLGTMVDTAQYNKKFLVEDSECEEVIFGTNIVENTLDKEDLDILHLLANNARLPLLEIARRVKLSSETVKRRMKEMERKNIIIAYRLALDLNKLGYEFFKAIIYFKKLTKKDELALREWMRNHPNSLYYIRSLAPWEVEFEFAVKNYQEFNAIVNELRQTFPHVIRNHEHLIMIYENWMPGYEKLLTNMT